MKETKEQQEVPTFEADTTFDISDISTDTEITAHLPREDQSQDTQVGHDLCHMHSPMSSIIYSKNHFISVS